MNLNPQYFSTVWLITGALFYAGVLVMAGRAAEWWRLRNPDDLNVLLYSMLGVFVIWLMNTHIEESEAVIGPTLHLLGATLLTMMFGWAFAILALSMVALTFTLLTADSVFTSLTSLPWDILATCALPVFTSYQVFRFVERLLPHHFFVYIFVCVFFNAALAMASVVLVTTAIHVLSGAFSLDQLSDNYLPYGLILMLPEAFVTGMLMTLFVAYHPEWVSTFNDRRYLHKK